MMPYQFDTTREKRSCSRSSSAASPESSVTSSAFSRSRDQREAEIGLVALLIEIELDQRAADEMGHPGADDGVDQRRPDEITRDVVGRRADHQRAGGRQVPQDHHEGRERDDRAEQRDADVQRRIDEHADVVGDALVGVVGLIALEPHAVMRALAEPAAEIAVGQPAPPPDLQPLLEIELIDGGDDEGGGEHAEHAELVEEGVPVLVLERVVEGVVPGVELDVQPDLEQLERDDRDQQDASRPAVVALEIGRRDMGKVSRRVAEIRHWGRLQALRSDFARAMPRRGDDKAKAKSGGNYDSVRLN